MADMSHMSVYSWAVELVRPLVLLIPFTFWTKLHLQWIDSNAEPEPPANQEAADWTRQGWICLSGGSSSSEPLLQNHTECEASSAFTLYKESAEGDIAVSLNAFHSSHVHSTTHTYTHTHMQHTYVCTHMRYKCAKSNSSGEAEAHIHTVDYSNMLNHVASGWRGYKAVLHQ